MEWDEITGVKDLHPSNQRLSRCLNIPPTYSKDGGENLSKFLPLTLLTGGLERLDRQCSGGLATILTLTKRCMSPGTLMLRLRITGNLLDFSSAFMMTLGGKRWWTILMVELHSSMGLTFANTSLCHFSTMLVQRIAEIWLTFI